MPLDGARDSLSEAEGCYAVGVRPIIALLTDFGLRDHYVASMKGVILGICPDASLVDITHDIPPQDVAAGALELAACFRTFPPGTVFLAVIDPGVGSRRRAVAAEAGGYRFVAPDNGLLAPILEKEPDVALVELTRPEYGAASVSRTFEGRDRFAPAAAWLARGVALDALGDGLDAWTALDLPRPSIGAGRIDGEVVRVDRFGNLVTNIGRGALGDGWKDAKGIDVSVAGHPPVPAVATYGDVPRGGACALIGSTDHVEVSVNGGSAAERFGVARGARVTVQFLQ
jgi:S-adenosyl-L-methionine hydrolase (adenosine-forming)